MKGDVRVVCIATAALVASATVRTALPFQRPEFPPAPTADAVEIDIGWVASVGVAGKSRILTSNTVDIEGTVQGQPFGSEIRVLVRCNNDESWNALDGVAAAMANGDWRLPGATLIGIRQVTQFCQLMAIVAPPFSDLLLNESTLSRKQYRSSNIVEIEIDPRLRAPPGREEITVSLVAGQPVAGDAAIPVPAIFEMTGRTRNLATGTRLWPLYNCDTGPEWAIGNSIEVGPDGSWSAAMVSMTTARAASQCLISVTAARLSSKKTISADTAEKLTAPHSLPIRLAQQPARIEITSITQQDGVVRFIDFELQKRARQAVQLSSEVASITIEGEQLPQDISASLAIQEEGSLLWFVFAADAQGIGVWNSSNVRVIMPGAKGQRRLLRVIATRHKDLDGRALIGSELESAAVGMSSIVQVEAPPPPQCHPAIQVTSVAGRDLGGISDSDADEPNQAPRIAVEPFSVVKGKIVKSCPGLVPLVGVSGGINRNRWRFSRVLPNAAPAWSAKVSFPDADPDSKHAEGTLLAILAADVFAGRFVDDPWLTEYTTPQAMEQLPIRLPPPSFAVRWQALLKSLLGNGGPLDMTMQFLLSHAWLMVFAAVALVVITSISRNLSHLRASINGFIDARRDNARAAVSTMSGSGVPTVMQRPYETRLNAEREEMKAALRQKQGPEIASLEKKIVGLDTSIEKFENDATFQKDGTSPRLSALLHHPAFAVLTLGELAFNAVAFRVLSDVDAVTFAASLSIGVALPVGAYYIGSTLRNGQKLTSREGVMLTTVTGGIIAALWAINAIRVAHINADPAIIAHNPALSYAFLPVNVLVVLAAAILAYMRNEPVGGRADALLAYRQQIKLRARLVPRLANRKSRLSAAFDRLDARYACLNAIYRTSLVRYLRYPPPSVVFPNEVSDRPSLPGGGPHVQPSALPNSDPGGYANGHATGD